jgi:hypothetical protein
MLAAERAEFLHFDPLCRGPLVLRLAVIAVLAFTALELNNFAWHVFPLNFFVDGGSRQQITK